MSLTEFLNDTIYDHPHYNQGKNIKVIRDSIQKTIAAYMRGDIDDDLSFPYENLGKGTNHMKSLFSTLG